MKISREINIQAKCNHGIAHKEWNAYFTSKELYNIAVLRGNKEKKTYDEKTRFVIESNKEFTKGFIEAQYADKSKNKTVYFTIETKSTELHYVVTFKTFNGNKKLIDEHTTRYITGNRGYKTSALYKYFKHIVEETTFLANVRSGEVIKQYEESVRKVLKMETERMITGNKKILDKIDSMTGVKKDDEEKQKKTKAKSSNKTKSKTPSSNKKSSSKTKKNDLSPEAFVS